MCLFQTLFALLLLGTMARRAVIHSNQRNEHEKTTVASVKIKKYKDDTITMQRRRRVFLASCTIAFTILTSCFVLPAAFKKLNEYYTSDNSSVNNNVTSLELWLDLQRPSQRRNEDDNDISNLIAGSDANGNNVSGNGISDTSIISAIDLTHLSYDSSCLSDEGHHVLGARYLEERRSATEEVSQENDISHRRLDRELSGNELLTKNSDHEMSRDGLFIDNDYVNLQYLRGGTMSGSEVDENLQDQTEIKAAAARIQKTKMMSPKKMLLRTAAGTALKHNDEQTNRRSLINDYEEEGWSTHTGAEVAPPSSNTDAELLQQHIMDYVNGQGQEDISMKNNAAGGDSVEEEDDDDDELFQRLQQVMKVTQSIHRQYGGTPPPTNNNTTAIDTMTQYSHTSKHSRQRLLTGSYATWQWYDRSNLASPVNLNLNKVSRVNYAFFQSDTDGFIFGTDSWADPNVLNGPYDFSVNREKLPSYCQGGKGRDDGKNIAQGGGSILKRRRTQLSFGDVNDDLPKCEYFERCHRNFPNSKVCNVHKYKEGLIYLSHQAGAEIYPSIGGWTLSGSFPTVADDVEKRRRFAKECVGLIEDYGFDGIDIGEFSFTIEFVFCIVLFLQMSDTSSITFF